MSARVLVADDSAYVRQVVADRLRAAGHEVVAMARDGVEAVRLNLEATPDVVVLDLRMPNADGLAALRGMNATRPVPTLVFASLDGAGAGLAIEALAEGALDIVPKSGSTDFLPYLLERIDALGPTRVPEVPPRMAPPRPKSDAHALLLAGSTGAPRFLERLLRALPAAFPVPIFVAQHMPEGFTEAFAARLDELCDIHVMHGADGMVVRAGEACVLPAACVTTLAAIVDDGLRIHSEHVEDRQSALPSASALALSAATVLGGHVTLVIVSGMGDDGAEAVASILAAGGSVFAQAPDEAPIRSMPVAAIQAGATAGRVDDIVRALTGTGRAALAG